MAELPQPLETTINGATNVDSLPPENPLPNLVTSKRQRRPSVRLGEIGHQPATLSYETFINRRTKQLNDPKFRHNQRDYVLSGKSSSKTRPLLNLSNGGGSDGNGNETLDSEDKNQSGVGNHLELVGTGNRRRKRGGSFAGGTKRVRTNWVSNKVDEGGEIGEGDEKFSGGGNDGNEWYRDFDPVGSESPPLKEHSPDLSLENTGTELGHNSDKGNNEREGTFLGQKRPIRTRVSLSHSRCGTSSDKNGVRERGRCRSLEEGVQTWLNGLGLGQYIPVFEIHEVDEEVLPLLTLDDLRDMGINAVGSRRKLFCAIQKLAKGFL